MDKNQLLQMMASQAVRALKAGLSRFAMQDVPVALILSQGPSGPHRIFDSDGLLPSAPDVVQDLENLFIADKLSELQHYCHHEQENLLRKGLSLERTSAGGTQVWVVPVPANSVARHVYYKWMLNTAQIFQQTYIQLSELIKMGAEGNKLHSYSLDSIEHMAYWAVVRCVYSELDHLIGRNINSSYLGQFLNVVIELSVLAEEKHKPNGVIQFINFVPENEKPLPDITVSFSPNRLPNLANRKQALKLLNAASEDEYRLVTNGVDIFGYNTGRASATFFLEVHFTDGLGSLICSRTKDEIIATVLRGQLFGVKFVPDTGVFAPIKEKWPADAPEIIPAVKDLCENAIKRRKGTMIAIFSDPDSALANIQGTKLATPIQMTDYASISRNLSFIDGALVVGVDTSIRCFGAILEGKASDFEDRGRGARYNSAIRFSGEHPDAVIVVVSEDGPISIITNGREIKAGRRLWGGCWDVDLETWLKQHSHS